MSLKLDTSKAYDRVKWRFFDQFYLNWAFYDSLVNNFMTCVTSAQHKICHAWKECGEIMPERGICQGDLLSSYLFLICIKGFTALI